MLVAQAGIKLDQVFRLFGSVHGQLMEPLLKGPLLASLQQGSTDSFALNIRVDRELMDSSNACSREVLALILAVGRFDNNGARELALGFGYKALTASDALGCDIWRLIHCGVVESHGAETCVRPMEQIRDFEQRVARLEGSGRMHAQEVCITPDVEITGAARLYRAASVATCQNVIIVFICGQGPNVICTTRLAKNSGHYVLMMSRNSLRSGFQSSLQADKLNKEPDVNFL